MTPDETPVGRTAELEAALRDLDNEIRDARRTVEGLSGDQIDQLADLDALPYALPNVTDMEGVENVRAWLAPVLGRAQVAHAVAGLVSEIRQLMREFEDAMFATYHNRLDQLRLKALKARALQEVEDLRSRAHQVYSDGLQGL